MMEVSYIYIVLGIFAKYTTEVGTQQWYFPNDNGQTFAQVYLSNVTVQERGTDIYQKSVEKVISDGISSLTLAINRIAPTLSPDSDIRAYGPVSIVGALFLVLLGSIGATFDEISNLLGLASGVDIRNKGAKVHEQLGMMLDKLEQTSGFEIGNRLMFASAVFVENSFPISSTYKQASQDVYKSDVMNVDFRRNAVHVQDVVNSWVADKTNGKIPDLFTVPPPPETKLIITSVLYFKSTWEYPFYEGHTRWRPFFANGRNSKMTALAEMMANGGEFPYYRDNTLGCEIMGFPYKGNKTTMFVILPADSSAQRLREFENRLTTADILRLVDNTAYTEAVVLFPKMKLESTVNLQPILYQLGVQSLFIPSKANIALISPTSATTPSPSTAPSNFEALPNSPSSSNFVADRYNVKVPDAPTSDKDVLIFSRIREVSNCTNPEGCNGDAQSQHSNRKRAAVSSQPRIGKAIDALESIRQSLFTNPDAVNPGLYADEVVHKVYMDITESGTEAAAATGISLNRSGGRVTFRADIPFLFFIMHHETKTILFWGSVKTPTPSSPP